MQKPNVAQPEIFVTVEMRFHDEIRRIFSPQVADVMIKMIQFGKNTSFPRNDEEMMESITRLQGAMVGLDNKDFVAIAAEFGEKDEGYDKSRIARFTEAAVKHIGAIRATVMSAVQDIEERGIILRKRDKLAGDDYRNLVATMGANHPYTLAALEYYQGITAEIEKETAKLEAIMAYLQNQMSK